MSFYNSFNHLNNLSFNLSAWNTCSSHVPTLNSFSMPSFSFNNFLPFNFNFGYNQNYYNYSLPTFNFNAPTFNFNTSKFSFNMPIYNNVLPGKQSYSFNCFQPMNMNFDSYIPKTSSSDSNKSHHGKSKHIFANLSRREALQAARSNSNLEELTNGQGWSISSCCFSNDIPFAKKGTGALLSKISAEIGEDLVVTSALGTKTSPHAKGSSSCSHYNENNPKLDFGGGLNQSEANRLANKLRNTDYFSRVAVEANGDGNYHLDVQIKDSAYNKLSVTA